MPDWIVAILVGGVAGWLASIVMRRDATMGIFWNVIVGIIGALVGGTLLGMLNLGLEGWVGWFVASVVGAIVLLGVVNLVQRKSIR